MPRSSTERASLVILIPCFNDWAALEMMLERLDRVEFPAEWQISAVIVDDASTSRLPRGWPEAHGGALDSLEILRLRCNLGHQRAIAIGLYHAHEFTDAAAVAVMDGDGEDRVEDLPALLEEFELGNRRETVFAARGKRMTSLTFQLFYRVYRVLHRVLTGVEVRVGNFSVLPREAVTSLMSVSDLWNHYAAAVFRALLPRRQLPLARGPRLAGESKMNFVSLLTHGLNAISVFSDQVSARLLAATAIFGLPVGGLAVLGLVGWFAAGTKLPGWFPFAAFALLMLVVQSLAFATVFVFLIANRRSATSFIPQRDASYFILGENSDRRPDTTRKT